MKRYGNVMWGITLILVGILIGINNLNIAKFNIFFEGWWTLFIIIPFGIGLFTDENKIGNAIGVFIGIFLLLVSRGIVEFDLIWDLILPGILIIIGLTLIFKNYFIDQEIKKIKQNIGEDDGYWATFGVQNLKFVDEEFKSTELNAIFGSIKIDLTQAIIKEDIIIKASAIFGGIEILVPQGVRIKLKSLPIFGGTNNKTQNDTNKKSFIIYIDSVTIFGGVEIK